MKPRHQVSRAAIELIERFEGYRAKAARLPEGRWTIGYGHTLTARQGAEVSPADAEALLLYDLIAIAHAVNELTFTPLTQNQFDALCAFAFNLGAEKFRGSDVLKRVNEGALIQAACAMELWRKAEFQGERIVIDALVRRRAAEKALFLTPTGDAWTPVPSAVVKPEIDYGAAALVPAETPAEVITSLQGERVVLLREGEPAPIELDADEHPLTAAAEAVTGRLSRIFPEAAQAEAPQLLNEPAPNEPMAGPKPSVAPAPEEDASTLNSPELQAEAPDLLEAEPRFEADGLEPSPDLFQQPDVANDPQAAGADLLQPEAEVDAPPEEAPAAAEQADDDSRERVVIDDTVPYEFIPPRVQALPHRTADGFFSLVVTAILGLAFFAGGLFWATNAQPGTGGGFLTPKVVGALAAATGVGLFSIAVYMILQRLGRAAERPEEPPAN